MYWTKINHKAEADNKEGGVFLLRLFCTFFYTCITTMVHCVASLLLVIAFSKNSVVLSSLFFFSISIKNRS